MAEIKYGWNKDSGGWFYVFNIYEGGYDYYYNVERYINGYYYAFSGGYMVTGFSSISGTKKYYNPKSGNSQGRRMSGWLKVSGDEYYAYSDGSLAYGNATINGVEYYFNSAGKLSKNSNWSGRRYRENGVYVKGKWKKIDGNWYYFNSSGYCLTGGDWNVNGKHYWFASNGICLKDGVKKVNGKWYHYKETTDVNGKGSGCGVRGECLSDKKASAPTNLKCVRDNLKITSTWKLPKNATSGNYRYKSLKAVYTFHMNGGGTLTAEQSLSTAATSTVLNLDSFKTTKPVKNKSYNRNSFYPVSYYTSSQIKDITLTLVVTGEYVKDTSASRTFLFKAPKPPTITWSYSNNVVSCKIKTDKPKAGAQERYDTRYFMGRYGKYPNLTIAPWTSTTKTEYNWSVNVQTLLTGLGDGQYYEFRANAYSRGLFGNYPESNKAISKSYFFLKPPKPAITAGKYTNGKDKPAVTVDKKRVGGKITVYINGGTYSDAVKGLRGKVQIKLRRAKGTVDTPGSFSNVANAVGTALTTALYDYWEDVAPQDGEYVWYQLEATYNGLSTRSDAVRADALYTAPATAETTQLAIHTVDIQPDGTTAKVVVKWKNESLASKGTEVTWSDDLDAWLSTDEPKKFEFNWEDSTTPPSGWAKTGTVYVRGLELGKTYYFKARRHYTNDTYTEYSGSKSASTKGTMTVGSVSLGAPSYVLRGEPIPVYWTFDGDRVQRRFDVHPVSNPNTSYAAGYASVTSTTIPPEIYGNANELEFKVSVVAGEADAKSNAVTVQIVDRPVVRSWCSAVCQNQPFGFEIYTKEISEKKLIYKVKSEGIVAEYPDRILRQLEGDILGSDALTPSYQSVAWTSSNLYQKLDADRAEAQAVVDEMEPTDPGYDDAVVALNDTIAAISEAQAELVVNGNTNVAAITLPRLDLIDTGSYTIDAVLVDLVTELQSEVSSCQFKVEWAHQAPEPTDINTVAIDDDGKMARIYLFAPQDAAEGDRYDIYRGSRAGFDLISEGLELESVVTDRWPAFGDQQYYRIVCRTENGDIEWKDYYYSLPAKSLRFDWADGSAETYYNIQLSDNFNKSFERREHQGGKGAGYWNSSYERTGSYSAVRLDTEDNLDLEALGRHAGTAFCRTPEGHAFECNVNVAHNASFASALDDYVFTVTEVELTDAFRPQEADNDIEGDFKNSENVSDIPEEEEE